MLDIEMKDLIATVAKMLVDEPDQVVTTEIKGQQTSGDRIESC